MGKKQPELYRIPRKPGYLGGYNWRATTLGCLLLLVVNFVATQYIAARFQYQAALGAPILRAKSGGVYQPFSWIAWGWRYCTSQDERIRRPFFEGEMIVFAGSFLCIGIFFALANRRARKLTENAEDLHGSARGHTAGGTVARSRRCPHNRDLPACGYIGQVRSGRARTSTGVASRRFKPPDALVTSLFEPG